MRLAIETTSSRGPLAGIGQYVLRLSEAILPLLNPEEELRAFDGLFCRRISAETIRADELRNTLMSDDVHRSSAARIKYQAFLSLRGASAARYAFRYIKEKAFQAAEKHFDVFHAVQGIPPGPFRKPVLPVIHDLSHIRFPEAHPIERVHWLESRLKFVVDEVPFIQTVSQFSKAEIVKLLGVPEGRIHVVYPGIAPSMSIAANDALSLAKYDIMPGRYFLMVSTREPRKNFKTATEAYTNLPAVIKDAFPLIWVGHSGWGELDLSPRVESAIRQGRIRVTGYVSDRELASFYRNTALFMMPSIYEGFGMPVTEALSFGARVAISDIPVFREVAGEFAFYVPPLDIESWRRAMIEATDVEPSSVPPALELWLQRYNWTVNASSTLHLCRRLSSRDY